MEEGWKREYDKAIELYDEMVDLKEELRLVEEKFEKLMKNLMPEIWLKYSHGTKWERDRPFFLNCSSCHIMAITVLKDKKK